MQGCISWCWITFCLFQIAQWRGSALIIWLALSPGHCVSWGVRRRFSTVITILFFSEVHSCWGMIATTWNKIRVLRKTFLGYITMLSVCITGSRLHRTSLVSSRIAIVSTSYRVVLTMISTIRIWSWTLTDLEGDFHVEMHPKLLYIDVAKNVAWSLERNLDL
jgi:hypothetical protein